MKGDVIRFERGKAITGPQAASSIDDREEEFLVGREKERALFERFLAGEPMSKHIWNLYGTGGVGKSTLLDAFRRQARRLNAVFLLLDSREFRRTGNDFCKQLLLQLPSAKEKGSRDEEPLDAVLRRLNRLAQDRQVVVALDTFEEMTGMEGWLREQFLRELDPGILVLLAGRYPLKGQWLLSPAWRERTLWLAIDHLTRTDVLNYARKCGLTEEAQGERLWERTRGHGLSLSLAVSTELLEGSGPLNDAGWSSELASSWLKEVADEELRQLVEAASMLRQFNQELLAYVVERDISADAFGRLTALSFVRKIDRGWRLHDLMRESTRSYLRERAPGQFGKLMERCVRYYASIIRGSHGKRDVAWEVGELFGYIGDAFIRAHLNTSWKEEFIWEPLSAANLGEGLQYLQRRRNEARTVTRRGVDPMTGDLLELTLSKAEMLYAIEGLDLEELLSLGQQSVMLLKAQDGSVQGLSAIIPINRGTLDYLEQNPFSGPYIRSLSAAERKELDVPESEQAGWFIKSIDVLEWTDSALLMEGGSQMYNYMCSGKLFFASPPPLPMFYDSHLGFGFEAVPDVFHCSYDGKTPTPTFVLDTRGKKLDAFLAAMLHRIGIQLEPAEVAGTERSGSEEKEDPLLRFGLTEREREVTLCVIEGCSNLEIAARLFVSEITVKKHLSSVYAKMQVKNRSQLIKAVLQ
ncbi:LuxR C-terminal-related transcriptional regulator [Paenibacillus sedimenti]|uniref:AAA family ATPase n=1 Tax=Paenibacillus sedimenti TaxID=2770274 RepID=A0A926KTN8_9BACL|nr:LuxR family transcriptional regulator [Paenibacillus sedimenti]MBD0383317.1 AAA family ATPase [Paenibacillus sedimenti]